jgi:hypothetical protein
MIYNFSKTQIKKKKKMVEGVENGWPPTTSKGGGCATTKGLDVAL